MGRIRESSTQNRILAAAILVVSTLIPAVVTGPGRGVYSSHHQPAYESSYNQESPGYTPSYGPPPPQSYSAPVYQPYQPSYEPSYTPPSYEPSYQPAYQSSYEPNYPVSYQKPSYQDKYEKPKENYDAITYKELNVSIHCGVVPATNDDFYQASKDIAPFGKYPWVVQITDVYDNFVCQGVKIHKSFVLTARSCIYGSTDKYRVRVDDWDVLTNYNEYEAYKNAEFKISDSYPVSYDDDSSYEYNGGGGDSSKMVLLEINSGHNVNDKYPAHRDICLPTYYPQYYSPPAYSPPSYSPPAYQPTYSPPAYQPAYQPSYSPPPYQPSYSPPAYQPPSYEPSYSPPAYQPSYSAPAYQAPSYEPSYQPSYSPPSHQPRYRREAGQGGYGYQAPSYTPSYSPPSYQPSYQPSYAPPAYSECWVVGWYGSLATSLQNHPAPKAEEEHYPVERHHYKPSYKKPYTHPIYQKKKDHCPKKHQSHYDLSKVERRAKVKKVKCPSSGYQEPKSESYGYGYKSYQDEEVCFVGVDGYDACVADKGAAIFCLVPDKGGYDAGSYQYGGGYSPNTYQATYPPYQSGGYYQKDIVAAKSQPKKYRERAVLYAIVQKTTKCSSPPKYIYSSKSDDDEYDSDDYSDKCSSRRPNYQESYVYRKKPRPLKASLVDEKAVESILKVFWEPPDYHKY